MSSIMTLEGKLIFRVADVILCQPDQDPVSLFDELLHAQLEGKQIRVTVENLS